MHLLNIIGIASHGILFEEQRIAPAQKKGQFDAIREKGYSLVGKHLSQDVFLFKGNNRYLLISITDQKTAPEALGAIIDDAEETIESLSKKQIDVFDGGAVGEMALHIPAFRDPQGRFIYLIEKNRTDDFYASDFEETKE